MALTYFHGRRFQLLMQSLVCQKREHELGLDFEASETQIKNRMSYTFECRVVHCQNDYEGKKVTSLYPNTFKPMVDICLDKIFSFVEVWNSTLRKLRFSSFFFFFNTVGETK